jgi:hypothetical protein
MEMELSLHNRIIGLSSVSSWLRVCSARRQVEGGLGALKLLAYGLPPFHFPFFLFPFMALPLLAENGEMR